MDFGDFFLLTPLNSFKNVVSWIYYFGIRVLTGEQDMTLISSRAWDKQSSISLSSREKRSPARDRSLCPSTRRNSWCILGQAQTWAGCPCPVLPRWLDMLLKCAQYTCIRLTPTIWDREWKKRKRERGKVIKVVKKDNYEEDELRGKRRRRKRGSERQHKKKTSLNLNFLCFIKGSRVILRLPKLKLYSLKTITFK